MAPSEDALDVALGVLREDVDVEVATTTNPGELDGVLHRAGCRPIVVAGGDGSLHAVVTALHRRHELAERTLGLIPLGTGNDFARAPRYPARPGRGRGRAGRPAKPRPMDLIVDQLGGVVVNSVHAGAECPGQPPRGALEGAAGALRLRHLRLPYRGCPASMKPPFVRLRVEADGKVVSDMDKHILMVAIGNGTSVGGGTELTPDADPADGRLDVMVSLATGPLERFGYTGHLRKTEHEQRDDVISPASQAGDHLRRGLLPRRRRRDQGPERRRSWYLEPAPTR